VRVNASHHGLRILLIGFLVGIPYGPPASIAAEGFGPFPVRNFQALNLLVLAMPGDRAAVIPKGAFDVRLELAETADIARDETNQAVARMKYETLRSGLFLRYGVTDRLEVAAELPLLYRYRGFMEGAIKSVERATTGMAPARSALQNFGYVFDVRSGNRTLFSGEEGALGIGDTSLYGKYQVLTETPSVPALSLRIGVKIPTGNETRIFGGGQTDVGIGLALEKAVLSRLIFYGNVNGVFPTGRIAGLPLQPVISGIAALELLASDDLSFTAQFDYYSSPYHGTGTQVLDKGVTEAVFGFSYRLTKNFLWQVYGIENLDFIRGSAADFTASTVFTYRFGH
jgi:hypothetical protein